jgi:hypothetical protein
LPDSLVGSVVGGLKDATGSTSGAFLVLAALSLTAAALCVREDRAPCASAADHVSFNRPRL